MPQVQQQADLYEYLIFKTCRKTYLSYICPSY